MTNNSPALLKRKWMIWYCFYDSTFPQRRKKICVYGMNKYKTFEERRIATTLILANEIENLSNGYNPIRKEFFRTSGLPHGDLPFLEALEIATGLLSVSQCTKKNIRYTLNHLKKGALDLNLQTKKIGEIKKRDIKIILDHLCNKYRLSHYLHNRIRTNLNMVFKYLTELDIFEYNFIQAITKRKHLPARRVALQREEFQLLGELKKPKYALYRFIQIFYRSGSRIVELLRLRKEDIFLKEGYFEVIQQKGGQPVRAAKPILKEVAHLWEELYHACQPEQVVFGTSLQPGKNEIHRDSVTRDYQRWVKVRLGLGADFYSLKHLFLDQIAEEYGLSVAKEFAGHTSEKTTLIYAIGHQRRILEKMKTIEI